MNKYLRFLIDSSYRFSILTSKGFFNDLSDEKFLKRCYKVKFNKKLDIDNPQTFNEKLQWLKLYDRKPIYTTMVDKYAVKKYVAELIGEEYIIPTLGVWDRFEDIDCDKLPNQFVLKCTHVSGGLIICRDKSKLDKEQARAKITRTLRRNYYLQSREWPYKNVPHRIIAEKYMEDKGNTNLPVYKFFCFDGVPKIVQVIQNDKQPNETIDYFDTEWNLLELRQNFPNSPKPLPKPSLLSEMLELARVLSAVKEGFIRVDLYMINGKLYFSEYTFFSDAGFAKFIPNEWDYKLGKMIKLLIK